jgi:hypothetical protein|tara:strand:- start:162 stop:449 length:288 start_codon:yes stop_codon:yes gene_type:complete
MKYEKLCEMEIGDLMNSLMGQVKALNPDTKDGSNNSCALSNPIQPDDNIGKFGNEKDVHIKITSDGGIEIDSKEIAIKLSSEVFDAIKSFVLKGE